jgi:succinylarginine dihydrolase
MKQAFEVNFDGIVGPTHNYSGLSYGNTASQMNQNKISNPKEAALQGLEKMKFLLDQGLKQAVIPPQERPFLPILRNLGFSGNDQTIIKNAYRQAPELLIAASSAAAMWTANAATVSPSADSQDALIHFTPANLSSKFHRSIEAETTSSILKAIFNNPKYFIHHASLPSGTYFADEGAANHTRFCQSHERPGIQLFVFGRYSFNSSIISPKIFPARQTYEASLAISMLHALNEQKIIFVQQHPDAIDAGAFHNDVVSVGNENVFLFHEHAFVNKHNLLEEIRKKTDQKCHTEMIFLEVKAKDISLQDAIFSYLFNSQLITTSDDSMMILSPVECSENPRIHEYIGNIISSKENPINTVHFLDLKQSMQNGGGPACLRLRVVMTNEEIIAANQGVFLTEKLYLQLKKWIHSHYRDRLQPEDLNDPILYKEGKIALDELTKILKIGSIYSFQKN